MENKLPDGWKWKELLSIMDYKGGNQPPKKEFIYESKDGYVRLLQIRDFGNKPFPTYVPDSPKLKKVTKRDILLASGYKVVGYKNSLKFSKQQRQAAKLALDIYIYDIRRYIASYLAMSKKLDAIVFTGPVSTNNTIRAMIITRPMPGKPR